MGTFGNSIDKYDVYEPLGKGGFAVVYRAMCRVSGVEVAIKQIERKKIKASQMIDRVNKEVSIHSRLRHPSILQLYTFFEDENYVYLVLELCHNGELQKYLKANKRVLTEPEACTVMKQVVQGLRYLHSHGIIHRDLTLANLLLTKDMNIKIADFGLATQLQRPDERHMTMCGTPNYISPEVATRGSHGLETDVWGLGIMLYTCLFGKPPFDTDDGLKLTFTLVAMSEIKFPRDISQEAQDLILSLLKKNPKDRISLAKIMEHPFILNSHAASLHGPRYASCLSGDVVMTGEPSGRQSRNSRNQEISARNVVANKVSHIPVPPINSKRLRPVRQKTKNVICSILTTGDICLEFLKHKDGRETVWEVMRISPDGMRIIMYQPKKGKGAEVTESPPPLPSAGADAIYNYENIPEKHFKKYCYAHKFVELVKSKTPKITYYSSHAKCHYMENGTVGQTDSVPDFEATFYQGGKMCKSQSNITVLEPSSAESWVFDFFEEIPSNKYSSQVQFMWDHFRSCFHHCRNLDRLITELSETSEETVFPAIFGRRPQPHNTLTPGSGHNKENLSPQSVVNIPTMRGYESSIASTKLGSSGKSRCSKPIRQAVIPGVGKALQFSNGEIHVSYFDGTKMVFNKADVACEFTDTSGKTTQFKIGDTVLPCVIPKLSGMTVICQHLYDNNQLMNSS